MHRGPPADCGAEVGEGLHAGNDFNPGTEGVVVDFLEFSFGEVRAYVRNICISELHVSSV